MDTPLTDALRTALDAAISAGISQNTIAAAIGMQPIKLSLWRRGQKTLSIDVADRLASVLGLRVSVPKKFPGIQKKSA